MLSGGEKQRAAIARAVIARPQLLLADEPTGNVDPSLAQRLLRLFIELNKSGTAVVIATHDIALMDQYDAPPAGAARGPPARLRVNTSASACQPERRAGDVARGGACASRASETPIVPQARSPARALGRRRRDHDVPRLADHRARWCWCARRPANGSRMSRARSRSRSARRAGRDLEADVAQAAAIARTIPGIAEVRPIRRKSPRACSSPGSAPACSSTICRCRASSWCGSRNAPQARSAAIARRLLTEGAEPRASTIIAAGSTGCAPWRGPRCWCGICVLGAGAHRDRSVGDVRDPRRHGGQPPDHRGAALHRRQGQLHRRAFPAALPGLGLKGGAAGGGAAVVLFLLAELLSGRFQGSARQPSGRLVRCFRSVFGAMSPWSRRCS